MEAALAAAVSSSGRDYEAFKAPPGIGLQRWFMAAAFLSAWDYALLLVALFIIFVYYVLEFHIVGDILRGWKGDAVGLYYDPKSPVSARLVAKCGTLKKRYWPTPWLCSPHLQTLFLHFIGRSPPVEYQRQLYITSDGGTIALDWVKSPTFSEDGTSETRRKESALDETPTVIIIPGLTSDSSNHYVKHIARSCSDNGWRVLVANHRGLGGVSITSDQFYNAGWTEDLRKILLLVKRTYPKSPLLAIGTSIGANILVKYLGEEGPRTPLGGAVAISCPWDLLVCDRFMARMGVQFLYCKALVIGLQQYASLHQTALARLVDWDLVTKANSVRDFDDAITRHVGKYETVDTYYRRCSSSLFVESIAVPLLCISAEDDPICTKEAIPYDECRLNPNIILGVTGHGGHLAYFEGLDATSIWWVRAATEFTRVLLSSSLMHQQGNVSSVPFTKSGANIDQGPFLTMTESHQVAAQDSGCDGDFVTVAQENQSQLSRAETEFPQSDKGIPMDEGSNVALDNSVGLGPDPAAGLGNGIVTDDFGGPLYRPVNQNLHTDTRKASGPANDAGARSISTDVQPEGHPSVTLELRSSSEVAALRSALSQLLDQVPLPSSIVEEAPSSGSKANSNSMHTAAGESRTIEVPISGAVVAEFGNCMEATKDLLVSSDSTDKKGGASASEQRQNHSSQMKEEASRPLNLKRDLAGLRSQNRRTLWLLTSVALVTTFPLLGSALLVRSRGRIVDVYRRWLKRLR
ncbi:unnamed protein product [Calypogeia fissa]